MFIGLLSSLSSGGSHGVSCNGSRGIWGWPGHLPCHVEWRTSEKVKFLFFKGFVLVLAGLSFWQGTGRWAVIDSMGYRHFPHIS